ncbi:MAG TPA: YdeI/OmpD-associated family protein, partial [Methanocorpusculum sp.]|nr:YdeI/OmpD-associated family protein [Methanocorpusculum sp.]
EFRTWLSSHHATESECFVVVKKGRPQDISGILYYLDAVEEALCFGWIDSTFRMVAGVGQVQRFTPRGPKSHWSELNRERCRRLERLGLMTDAGRAVLPGDEFRIDDDVLEAMQKDDEVWKNFCAFPPLYQRIRIGNIQRDRMINRERFERGLQKLIDTARDGKMYGEWTDYGRLLEKSVNL